MTQKEKEQFKQKDKQLLLIELYTRLPYDVCVHIRYKGGEPCYGKLTPRDIQWFIDSKIEVIKPYLRPMSSMTEEEKREYASFIGGQKPFDSDFSAYPIEYRFVYEWDVANFVNWLNSHHFDYRGLIPKGLALKAPEGMYNIKKQ